jgi:hypothetical protein
VTVVRNYFGNLNAWLSVFRIVGARIEGPPVRQAAGNDAEPGYGDDIVIGQYFVESNC